MRPIQLGQQPAIRLLTLSCKLQGRGLHPGPSAGEKRALALSLCTRGCWTTTRSALRSYPLRGAWSLKTCFNGDAPVTPRIFSTRTAQQQQQVVSAYAPRAAPLTKRELVRAARLLHVGEGSSSMKLHCVRLANPSDCLPVDAHEAPQHTTSRCTRLGTSGSAAFLGANLLALCPPGVALS